MTTLLCSAPGHAVEALAAAAAMPAILAYVVAWWRNSTRRRRAVTHTPGKKTIRLAVAVDINGDWRAAGT